MDEPIRVRMPREGELFGVVDQLLGGARFKVKCSDGKERICRVPGKLRRRLWIKQGNVVLVKKWDLQGDERGDIVYRYNKTQTEYLRSKGFLNNL
ncbi:translation initiation factor eIF-1A [Nanoarchaeota archaeon]|nr:MAG: translation initiation factor eIF-1A [Nanoarchaeota archaeon]